MTHDELAPLPWERLEEETGKAYRAFILFRDLGYSRSVRKAYSAYMGRQHTTNSVAPHASYRKWVERHRWHERAEAWDMERLRAREDALERANRLALDELARRLPEILGSALEIALGKDEGGPGRVSMIKDLLTRAGLGEQDAEALAVISAEALAQALGVTGWRPGVEETPARDDAETLPEVPATGLEASATPFDPGEFE